MVRLFFIHKVMSRLGYYNEFTVVRIKIAFKLFVKDNSDYHHFSTLLIDDHVIECLINFQGHFNYIESLFFNIKTN